MPLSSDRLRKLGRFALIFANVIVLGALAATAAFVRVESGWATPVFRNAEQAFRYGTIGTEVMPLPVAHVLPDLFPEHFLPGGKTNGDWIEQFGFLRDSDPKANDGLPVGFAITNYRPQSGAPSPVPFVGFSCALCHSTQLRESDNLKSEIRYGPGSISLNLFAWLDAFQASILECEELPPERSYDPAHPPAYKMTVATIADAYRKKTGRRLGIAERAMTELWLRQVRQRLSAGLSRFDEPYGNGASRDPQYVPTGPTRTQPFRTLIRTVLDRPGNDMPVYTKIATVYSEDLRRRAQFDGGISSLYARSSMAALAAGATVQNMRLPEIVHNIRGASDYTSTLRPPRYDEVFPEHAAGRDAVLVSRGHDVYRQYCADCHGDRDPATGGWANGKRTGEVTPLAEIGTDGERVLFRHYGELGGRMYDLLPKDHPFHFERNEIWPLLGHEDNVAERGYINAPLDGMFLRGPYLHNASVLTLAELINLKKRRDIFYRGHNLYDPADVGFRTPDAPDGRNYFKFDAAIRGNSNRGHDYPWAYEDPRRNVGDLTALLEYLKTL